MDKIDEELDRINSQGKTPKTIYVGSRLQLDLETELNDNPRADLIGAQNIGTEEVEEYKGIPVVLADDVEPDYLKIETH